MTLSVYSSDLTHAECRVLFPLALPPALAADLRRTLRDARYLIAVGRLERVRWYRTCWAVELMGVMGA